jgi:putative colanic acid biosynthesis acetyltransferase WcaF
VRDEKEVRLSTFSNEWYYPGRGAFVRAVWYATNALVFAGWFPWPMTAKRLILRAFGAKVGRGVVVKPRVSIKYPWNISIGDHSWIGEGAWLDSIGRIDVGANCCLSQGCMVETGNHDWSSSSFDLIIKPVRIEDGAWAAVKSVLLPGSHLGEHAIVAAGSVFSGQAEPWKIYSGVPAREVGSRRFGVRYGERQQKGDKG